MPCSQFDSDQAQNVGVSDSNQALDVTFNGLEFFHA